MFDLTRRQFGSISHSDHSLTFATLDVWSRHFQIRASTLGFANIRRSNGPRLARDSIPCKTFALMRDIKGSFSGQAAG